jgi:DNA-dependent protein kinase catalytic subunit
VIDRLMVLAPVGADPVMPSWMSNILTKIMAPETHLNVRLFLAKIVVDRPAVFQPFATDWFR